MPLTDASANYPAASNHATLPGASIIRPLSWSRLLLFSQVQLAWSAVWIFQTQWLRYFLINSLHLNADTLGMVAASAAAVSFLLSPLAAHACDAYVGRRGKRGRRLLLLALSIGAGLSGVMQAWVPSSLSLTAHTAWLAVWTTLNGVLGGLLTLSWQALAFTLTDYASQRTRAFGWSSAVSSLSSVATTAALGVLPLRFFPLFSLIACAAQTVSFAFAIIGLTAGGDEQSDAVEGRSALPTAEVGTRLKPEGTQSSRGRERRAHSAADDSAEQPDGLENTATADSHMQQPLLALAYSESTSVVAALHSPSSLDAKQFTVAESSSSFVPSLARVWSNRSFRILLLSYVLSNLYFLSPRDPFVLQYAFGASQGQIALTGAVSQLACLAATPVVAWLAAGQRVGLRTTYTMLLAGWSALVLSCVWSVSSPHQALYWLLTAGDATLGGLQGMLASSILADCVAYDQLRWGGSPQSALYGAVLSGAAGWDSVIDSACYGLLAALGWSPDAGAQSPSPRMLRNLKWICCASALPGLLAAALMCRYPITHERSLRIVEASQRRTAQSEARRLLQAQSSDHSVLSPAASSVQQTPPAPAASCAAVLSVLDPLTSLELPPLLDASTCAAAAAADTLAHFSRWELSHLCSTDGRTALRRIVLAHASASGALLCACVALLLCLEHAACIAALGGVLCVASLALIAGGMHISRLRRIRQLDALDSSILLEHLRPVQQ